MRLLPPLYGGGYWVAVAQIALAYYGIALVLHYVVPAVKAVRSVQKGQRREGQVLQEARDSISESERSVGARRGRGGAGGRRPATLCFWPGLARSAHRALLYAPPQSPYWLRRALSGWWTSSMRLAAASSTAGHPRAAAR